MNGASEDRVCLVIHAVFHNQSTTMVIHAVFYNQSTQTKRQNRLWPFMLSFITKVHQRNVRIETMVLSCCLPYPKYANDASEDRVCLVFLAVFQMKSIPTVRTSVHQASGDRVCLVTPAVCQSQSAKAMLGQSS